MVARLTLDALWRNRWVYVVASPIVLTCFGLYVGGDEVLEIPLTALSLICATVLGPMFAIAAMILRELRHLPVTNRDLWRTTWVVATLVSTAILLVAKMTSVLLVKAFGGSPTVSTATMLLSSVYDFAWAGASLPLFPALAYTGSAARGTLAASVAPAGPVAAMLACFGLPILVSGVLPARAGDFTPVTAGLVLAGVALAFGSLVWTPRRGVMAGERAAQPRRPVALPGAAVPRTPLADRLTGFSRVAVPHLLGTAALPVCACLALAAYGVISGSGAWWFVPQTPDVFDRADTGDRGLTYFVLLPCGVASIVAVWAPWARVLKVLPLSVGQINALLLLTPFATWTILWLLGWSAYVFAYGPPRTFRVEFALGMAAFGALAHAALFRLQGSTAAFWIIGFISGLLPQVMKMGLRGGNVTQEFVIVSAFALCAAALLNHHTLTRSTSSSNAYRLPNMTPGMRVRSSM